VKKRLVKDVAASVRQRLQNSARSANRPFQEVLQYFAMERFLYRLTQSPYVDKFTLKGALMFTVWGAPATRPTKDIDLLVRTTNSVEAMALIIQSICKQPVEPDGLVFDARTVEGTVIKEDADYEGVRITFVATLQNARVPMQIDMGFGDVVVPRPVIADYPALLDFPAPRLRAYRRETVVAEKFEAMVKLGQLNSRMKDFFDIWLLSRQFDFDGGTLTNAIKRTFVNRKTEIPVEVLALSPRFADDAKKQTQWSGFLKKSRIESAPADFHEVIEALAVFLGPVAGAAREAQPLASGWKAATGWSERY
jgi:hypothetical protein